MRLLISKLHQRTWKESLKGVIRSHKLKDMQCDSQEKEDVKTNRRGSRSLDIACSTNGSRRVITGKKFNSTEHGTPILLFISLIETWSRQFSFCFLCLICFLIDLRILSPMFVNRLYKTKAEYSWRDIEVKDWYMLYLQQQDQHTHSKSILPHRQIRGETSNTVQQSVFPAFLAALQKSLSFTR
jgi:hypothetical protein